MPFFLSDQFKKILEDQNSNMKKIESKDGLLNTLGSSVGAGMGSQMYKSEFLKEKLSIQNEKRKKDRKMRKTIPSTEVKQEGTIKKGKIRDDQEDLEEVIDDLKNDLRMRDMELDELKKSVAFLEAENKKFKELYNNERQSKEVIEVKLKKNAIH